MTKLVGENALARTAAVLITRAQNRLVVRAASYYADWPPKQFVAIYLLSYCKVSRGDHGAVFEVLYGSPSDPTAWYQFDDDKPLAVSTGYPDETLVLQERMQNWEVMNPPWVDDREVVAYVKGLDHDRCDEVYPSNLRLMLHFVRLYDLILDRGHRTLNAWETDDLLKRLGVFLKNCIQDWEKVLG